MQEIIEILKRIRMPLVRLESEVVDRIKEELDRAGIEYKSEVRIAPRCRVDLLAAGGVAIEVKKGKPNSKVAARQVARYAAAKGVNAVILVSERGLMSHIEESSGKPIGYVALSRNWGLTV